MMEYVQHLLMRLFWVLVITLAVENGCNGCWEKERIALLQLKDSINFPNGTSLPSWEEDDYLDCCQWERVTCNSSTRRVIKLSLNATTDWLNQIQSRSRDLTWSPWYLNASILLPFESLQSLDLSENGLYGFAGNEGDLDQSISASIKS
ncbi:hypothetical protein Vadar_001045 [Vaccinium darrowii]|uniref:Uncharacterized protein n=1 Tax=Vaccinium darrowii TaxID=229202 RepID=A0ACB7Z2C9_9ERIC|nr:hypothetical protein Vadar_001045 [Vaccinium darrowii]